MADRFFTPIEAPRLQHLVRPGGGLSGELFDLREDISRGFDRVDVGCASRTEAETHYYVSNENGDDANDGLSEGTPKKYVTTLFNDVIPDNVNHHLSIQLRGKITENLAAGVSRRLLRGNIVIDGGPEVIELLGVTAADISSTLSVGLSTATWTVDQFAGKGWVEILDGPAAGERRSIHRNTATEIIPSIGFSVDPGVCTFRIVRPATELQGFWWLNCPETGGGYYIQRLFVNGAAAGFGCTGQGAYFTHLINESTYKWTFYCVSGKFIWDFGHYLYDPLNDFAYDSLTKCGVSRLGSTQMLIGSCGGVRLKASYLKQMGFTSAGSIYINDGCRFNNLRLYNTPNIFLVENIENCPKISFDHSSASGLLCADGSNMYFGDDQVEFNDNASYGIEIRDSKVVFKGAVSGSGNGKLGLRASQKSAVIYRAGTPPTLTGAAGDVSVSDPDTEESTWAAIEAGTPVAVLSELTTINKATNP